MPRLPRGAWTCRPQRTSLEPGFMRAARRMDRLRGTVPLYSSCTAPERSLRALLARIPGRSDIRNLNLALTGEEISSGTARVNWVSQFPPGHGELVLRMGGDRRVLVERTAADDTYFRADGSPLPAERAHGTAMIFQRSPDPAYSDGDPPIVLALRNATEPPAKPWGFFLIGCVMHSFWVGAMLFRFARAYGSAQTAARAGLHGFWCPASGPRRGPCAGRPKRVRLRSPGSEDRGPGRHACRGGRHRSI